jgi:hypothetical protein
MRNVRAGSALVIRGARNRSMSDLVMMLLVGFLFFALAGLAVLLIWLWQEPRGQQKQGRQPQRQAPKIVIRPRRFRTKEIVEQPRLPRPATRVTPPPAAPVRTPLVQTTRPPATRVTPPPAIPTPPAPPPPRTSPPPTPVQTRPPATRATPPPAIPTPAPVPQQTVLRATPEPVMTSTNGPKFGVTRFKVDFDTIHKRTGVLMRDCRCRECREMRADAGI